MYPVDLLFLLINILLYDNVQYYMNKYIKHNYYMDFKK